VVPGAADDMRLVSPTYSNSYFNAYLPPLILIWYLSDVLIVDGV